MSSGFGSRLFDWEDNFVDMEHTAAAMNIVPKKLFNNLQMKINRISKVTINEKT